MICLATFDLLRLLLKFNSLLKRKAVQTLEIFSISLCRFHSMSLQQLDCNHCKNFCLLQSSTMRVNQEDREYIDCLQKFIVSWNLLEGRNFVRGNAAYAQSCKQLKCSAFNIANVLPLPLSLSLSRYDYNISCSGGLQISFRYCGNRRHFDQVTR